MEEEPKDVHLAFENCFVFLSSVAPHWSLGACRIAQRRKWQRNRSCHHTAYQIRGTSDSSCQSGSLRWGKKSAVPRKTRSFHPSICLAIVWSITKFQPYLYERHFTVVIQLTPHTVLRHALLYIGNTAHFSQDTMRKDSTPERKRAQFDALENKLLGVFIDQTRGLDRTNHKIL